MNVDPKLAVAAILIMLGILIFGVWLGLPWWTATIVISGLGILGFAADWRLGTPMILVAGLVLLAALRFETGILQQVLDRLLGQ